jgi:HEPN domain-containing protein
MREEIFNWFAQAKDDYEKAQILYGKSKFDGCVFFCQQAAEKALKAACMAKVREIPKGHSIVYLASVAKAPASLMSGIRDLNPEYLITRYPDMAAGIPARLYDAEIARRHLSTAKEVLEWSGRRTRA